VRKIMLGLVASIAMASALLLPGCSENIQESIATDVNNKSFTFASGAVFHPALADMVTTLTFTLNGTDFTLASANGTAVGANTFQPCILTVALSTYAAGTGPQAHDEIKLGPCDFDLTNKTLIVGNGTITAISAPAVQQ